MTLESGDMLFFDITPTGMVLQMREGRGNGKDEDGADGDRGGCDTVALRGREVARLLWALRQAGMGIAPVNGEELIHEELTVGYTDGMFFLYGDENVCSLERHEMYMVLCAMTARVWRMFA